MFPLVGTRICKTIDLDAWRTHPGRSLSIGKLMTCQQLRLLWYLKGVAKWQAGHSMTNALDLVPGSFG
jgi:hypothetical protein